MLVLFRSLPLFLILLVSEMVSYDAPSDRADDAVMTGVVARDAADQRALDAAPGLGRRRTNEGKNR
jgi:hypothetical protein